MMRIGDIRESIHDYFDSNADCQKYFFDKAHGGEYAAYYTSMYLLQDATESLWSHRETGFTENPLQAYLEFWGVMQAVIIQQDSIAEIYEVLTGGSLATESMKAWSEIRFLRHVCAGHPVRRDRPKSKPLTRSFMGRNFGGYDEFTYEQWQPGGGITHPRVGLGVLMDEYAAEATERLAEAFSAMKRRWPPET
jgi:hypothetical protein